MPEHVHIVISKERNAGDGRTGMNKGQGHGRTLNLSEAIASKTSTSAFGMVDIVNSVAPGCRRQMATTGRKKGHMNEKRMETPIRKI